MNLESTTTVWGRLSGVRAGIGHVEILHAEDEASLQELLRRPRNSQDILPVGAGTNLVGSDEDNTRLCLKLSKEGFGGIHREGQEVTAGGACSLTLVIRRMLQEGLGGLSSLVGIPGTLASALAGNAGAHNHSIFEFTQEAWGYCLTDGAHWQWHAADGGWGYRVSPVPGNVIITGARLLFQECDVEQETLEHAAEIKRRKETTPPYPTLGSTFKNPEGNSAGRLLDEAGCKGISVGAFSVYEGHANWIVNKSGQIAPAADYRALVDEMKARVRRCHGVELQEEVRFA